MNKLLSIIVRKHFEKFGDKCFIEEQQLSFPTFKTAYSLLVLQISVNREII